MADEDLSARDPWWVARQKIALDELRAAGGALWWLQDSPQDGATRLMRLPAGGELATAVWRRHNQASRLR